MPSFAIEVADSFFAHHALRLPAGLTEPRHAHTFHVTVRIESPSLDAIETVIDFHIIQGHLRAILAPWHDADLNEIKPFTAQLNPTAERIAEEIARQLAPRIPAPARLTQVRLTEAPGCTAFWLAS